MSRALQIYYSSFDADFLRLPEEIRQRIQEHLDEVGRNLTSYPHYRMTGGDRFRLRVGDYRVIYRFEATRHELHLLAVGHRREIYR